MEDNLIVFYKNVDDLKQKIIAKYIKELRAIFKSNNDLLKSKTWATDESDDYYRNCRLEKKQENHLITEQIHLLNNGR